MSRSGSSKRGMRGFVAAVVAMALVQSGAVAQDLVIEHPGDAPTMTVEEFDFHIEAADDVAFHLFNVLVPGSITVHVDWEGESTDLEVQLTGRRRAELADPAAPYAQTTGDSTRKLSYQVTEEDVARGVGWRLVIRDPNGLGDAHGRATISTPIDPEAQQRFDSERISLRSGDLWPSVEGTERVLADANRDDGVHGIITLTRACSCNEQHALERAGFHRQTFLPRRSSFGLIERGANPDDPAIPGLIDAITPLDPEDKIDPRVLVGDYHDLQVHDVEAGAVDHVRNDDGTVDLAVSVHPDVSHAAANLRLRSHAAAVEHLFGSRYLATIAREDIMDLAEDDAVAWIEPGPLPVLLDNDTARTVSSVDAVTQIRVDGDAVIVTGSDGLPLYDGYTGKGVIVSVFETFGIAADHPDLEGKVLSDFNIDGGHKTHVAGTIAGTGKASDGATVGGLADPGLPFQFRGMAPEATLWDSEAFSGAPSGIAGELRDPPWIEVSNHSYTTSLNGDYDGGNADTDRMIAGDGETPRRPVLKSAGNNGGNPSTQSPQRGEQYGFFSTSGHMKNAVIVGSWCAQCAQLSGFSSMGPAYDGRILPTVVAQGSAVVSAAHDPQHGYTMSSGTSMATPVVSGIVALLLEAWKDIYRSDDDDPASPDGAPLPSTIRAILAQTAIDVDTNDARGVTDEVDSDSDPSNGNDRSGLAAAARGPDYVTGWGIADAEAAIGLVSDQRIIDGVAVPNRIVEDELSQGQVLEYDFAVTPGTPVKVTLAWDDVAASEASKATEPRLVNDLDLELVAPDGTVSYPWQLGHRITRPDGTAIAPQDQTPGTPIAVAPIGPRPDLWSRSRDVPPGGNDSDPGTRDLYEDYVPANALTPGGTWAAVRGRDHLNNIEQVEVNAPQPGRWKARVSGFDVRTGQQDFSLVGLPYPPLPDLVPTVEEQVAIPYFDEDLPIRWRIANRGDAPQGSEVNYRILLSRDLTVDESDVELTDTTGSGFSPLEPHDERRIDSTVRITEEDAAQLLGLPVGTFRFEGFMDNDPFLLVAVDPDDELLENHERNNVVPVQVARTVDVEMVFDRSGSMSGFVPASGGDRAKISILRDAGRLFYRLMRLDAGDRAGQVSFATDVADDLPLTAIGRDNLVSPFLDLLDGLHPADATNIRGGLETALAELGERDGRRRVIIFFSDGEATTGGDPHDEAFLRRFGDEDVRVFSVGFGTRGRSGYAGIDIELLQKLGESGDGGFFHVTDEPAGLAKFFVEAVAGAIGVQTVIDPVENLAPRRATTTDVGVTSEDRSVTFITTWDDPTADLEVSLRSPSGVVMSAEQLAGRGAGVKAALDDASVAIEIELPFASGSTAEHEGTWQLTVSNATASTVSVATTALAESTIRAESTLEPPEEGTTEPPDVGLRTSLRRRGGTPLVGAQVTVTPRIPLIGVGDAVVAAALTQEEIDAVPLTDNGDRLTEVERMVIAAANKLDADPIPTGLGTAVELSDMGDGTYQGRFHETGTPGPYAFTTRSTFQTEDCAFATRETERSIGLDLAVDEEETIIELIDEGDGDPILRIVPRDRFGNLFGPGQAGDVVVSSKGALEVDGPVVDHHDGTYVQQLRVTDIGTATVAATVDGVTMPTQSIATGAPVAIGINPAGGDNRQAIAIAIEPGHDGDVGKVTGVQFVGPGGTLVTDGVEVDAKSGIVHAEAPAKMPPGRYRLALVTAEGVGARSSDATFLVVDPDMDPAPLQAFNAAAGAIDDGATPTELVALLHALWDLPMGGMLTEANVAAASTAALAALTGAKGADLGPVLELVGSLATVDARSFEVDPAPTPAGQGITLDLGNDVAVTFDQVIAAGSTSVQIAPTATVLPGAAEFSAASVVYDVTSTASHEGGINLTLPYRASEFPDEDDLRILHFDGGGWEDATVAVDTVADTITAHVTSLSPFVVVSGEGTPAPPAPTCQGLPATIVGTSGDDALTGTDGRDVIVGLGGHDVIDGLDGDDLLCGGPGADRIRGGDGDDRILGGDGDDVLSGEEGDDIIAAGSGNDGVDGGNGADRIDLGPGDDEGSGGNDTDVILGGDGDDTITAGHGDDALKGGSGHDVLDGGHGDDLLRGDDGDDVLSGGSGDDVLWGGPGDDDLDGGRGQDVIHGGGDS